MAKTTFSNGTVVLSTFMNKIFGSGASGGHKHDGQDQDGSCAKVNLSGASEVTGELPVANMKKQDINTGTTGQLPASRVSGLPSSASYLGEIMPFYGVASPDPAWLVCDGGSIPAGAEYDDFRTLMGGTVTPNFKGKALFGYDATNDKFDAIGDSGQTTYVGEEEHSLTADENGQHSHTTTANSIGTSGTSEDFTSTGAHYHINAGSVGSSGLGQAHNNIPPYGVVSYLIRATI